MLFFKPDLNAVISISNARFLHKISVAMSCLGKSSNFEWKVYTLRCCYGNIIMIIRAITPKV